MKKTTALLLALAACGGEESAPAPKTAADVAGTHHAAEGAGADGTPAPVAPRRSGMSVQTELGEIDKAATERAFQGARGELSACYKAGLARVDYLGGELAFFLRIGEDGVRWSYLERSTLGDRDTERCMLGALGKVRWPKPKGGDAEVRKSVAFDASSDVRAPSAWSADRVSSALGQAGERLKACKEGAPGAYAVTAYVEPDGKDGKVQAVGVAPPSKEGEAKADCVTDAVKGLKMPSPGSYAAKVSFVL